MIRIAKIILLILFVSCSESNKKSNREKELEQQLESKNKELESKNRKLESKEKEISQIERKSNVSPKKKDADELFYDLQMNELKSPKDYLDVDGSWWVNLINETVIEGSISSVSSVAIFKDIKIGVNFYSKTGTLIASDSFTIYEYIDPGATLKFKKKLTSQYREAKSMSFFIVGASPVYRH